jgi:hypothetical protein
MANNINDPVVEKVLHFLLDIDNEGDGSNSFKFRLAFVGQVNENDDTASHPGRIAKFFKFCLNKLSIEICSIESTNHFVEIVISIIRNRHVLLLKYHIYLQVNILTRPENE